MAAATVMARPRKAQQISTDTDTRVNNSATAPLVTVPISATISELHTMANTVTDQPVEEGANISDHARPDPDGLTMECIISNTPISQDQQTTEVQSGSVVVQTTAQQAASQQLSAVTGYAEQAYKQLKLLRDTGTLCTVLTTLTTYRSMEITNLSIPRDSKNYDALHFTITFKKVRVVANKLTRNVVSGDKRVGPKVKAGAQTTKGTEQESSALFDSATSMSKSGNGTISGIGNFALSGGQ